MSENVARGANGVLFVDFTGTVEGFIQLPGFGGAFVDLVRGKNPPDRVVLIDYCRGGEQVSVVCDHLNLSGDNPLVGPSHGTGERFPVVQGTYVLDCLTDLPRVVAAGLKPGVVPGAQEVSLLEAVGAGCWCYNLVPAVLVSGQARCRVLGVVLEAGSRLDERIIARMRAYAGGDSETASG